MKKSSLELWLIAALGLIGAIGIFYVGEHRKPQTTTISAALPADVSEVAVGEPLANEADGEVHFAPPPEKPIPTQRLTPAQQAAQQALDEEKRLTIGTMVGHFANHDDAIKAVDAALAQHGGKGTFSARFGAHGVVAKTNADGIVVTFS